MARSRNPLDVEATWQLVEAAAAGDDAARNRLAEHCGPMIQRWLWFRWHRTPFRGLVEDGTQEVFLECFRPDGALAKVDRRRTAHGFPAFLRSVALHVAARVERREARSHSHLSRLAAAADRALPASFETANQLDRRWLDGLILAAMERLEQQRNRGGGPHSAREFLRLHCERQLRVGAIARLWNERVERVHELRRRAMRRFRLCLLRVLRAGGGAHGASEREIGRDLLSLLG